jgi:hypothetical protein
MFHGLDTFGTEFQVKQRIYWTDADLIILRRESPISKVNQNPSHSFADEANTIPHYASFFAVFTKTGYH